MFCTGAVNATACPRGSYRDAEGGSSTDDCYPCQPGMYCATEGLDAPTGYCTEGYYCPDFAYNDNPMPSDYPCTTGHYCLNGTGARDAMMIDCIS